MENNPAAAQDTAPVEQIVEPAAEPAAVPAAEPVGNAAPEPLASVTIDATPRKKKMGCCLKGCLISLMVSIGLPILLAVLFIAILTPHAESLVEQGRYEEAVDCYEFMEEIPGNRQKINEREYLLAQRLEEEGNYKGASDLFVYLRGKGYKDSAKRADNALYLYVTQLMEEENYQEALIALEKILVHSDIDKLKIECAVGLARECYGRRDYSECCKHVQDYIQKDELAALYYHLGMLGVYTQNGVSEIEPATALEMVRVISKYAPINEDAGAAAESTFLYEARLRDIYWECDHGYYIRLKTLGNNLYYDMPGDIDDVNIWTIYDDKGLHFYLDTSIQSNSASADTFWFSITGFSEYNVTHPNFMYVVTSDGEEHEFFNLGDKAVD